MFADLAESDMMDVDIHVDNKVWHNSADKYNVQIHIEDPESTSVNLQFNTQYVFIDIIEHDIETKFYSQQIKRLQRNYCASKTICWKWKWKTETKNAIYSTSWIRIFESQLPFDWSYDYGGVYEPSSLKLIVSKLKKKVMVM